MKTKFIGLDGFGEIEAVSKKKTTKKTKNLSTAQKSVRFAKRAATLCAKNIKAKNTSNKKKTAAKKPVRVQSTILDRQYAQSKEGDRRQDLRAQRSCRAAHT